MHNERERQGAEAETSRQLHELQRQANERARGVAEESRTVEERERRARSREMTVTVGTMSDLLKRMEAVETMRRSSARGRDKRDV